MQNEQPDLHILGHWTYASGPDAKKTTKTIYVVANVDSVELSGLRAGISLPSPMSRLHRAV
jgi:hypothetical protein